MKTVTIQGVQLEYQRLPSAHPCPERPAMVFLHEGLGSVAMWRDFPQRVADACGCEAVVFSREGYGRSDPAPQARGVDYLHRQGIDVLPRVLDALELRRPYLFGHSDGASIALLCAGASATELSGIVVMAPHVLVEDITLAGIREAAVIWDKSDLPQRLARFHSEANGATVFAAWQDIWLNPAFRSWNIQDCLPAIRCPVLAIQGEDDEYGSMVQIDLIAAGAPDVELLKLADCRHSPHKDQPQAVIDAVSEFVRRVEDV